VGVGAGAWLDDLPLLVASLEQEWGIAVGDSYHQLALPIRKRHEILCMLAAADIVCRRMDTAPT
jgi:hypothetical protein